MKTFIFILLLYTVYASRSDFNAWLLEYNKHYDGAEYESRYNIWSKNIKYHSPAGPYHDLTSAEYKSRILLPSTSGDELEAYVSPHYINYKYRYPESNLTEFDWRSKGIVPAVRDQGSVGSCWAFSTTGAITCQRAIVKNVLEPLSVEQLVDCDDLDCGIFGGWPHLAFDYIIKTGGIESEASYPYCSGTGHCYPCMANTNQSFCGPPPSYCNRTCLSKGPYAVSLKGWTRVPVSDSDLENALVNIGPVAVLINAGTLQFHHGDGIWKPSSCNPKSLNHAVLLVGFGEQKSFGKVEKYWIIQNSWGTKFGEKGYFRMYRDQSKTEGTCGINTFSTIPFIKE